MPTYHIRATRDAFEIGYASIQAKTPEEAIQIFNDTKNDPETIDWVEFGCPNNDTDPADINDIEDTEDDEEPEGNEEYGDDPGVFAWRRAHAILEALDKGDMQEVANLANDIAGHYKPY